MKFKFNSIVGFIQQGNAVAGQPRPPNHIMARPQIPGAPMQWMQPQVNFTGILLSLKETRIEQKLIEIQSESCNNHINPYIKNPNLKHFY